MIKFNGKAIADLFRECKRDDAPAKDWRDMSAVEFTTRPKAAQVAMLDTGDHPTTGTIGLFDI